MFEGVRLLGSDERGIGLHTRRNRAIKNSQAPDALDEMLLQKYQRLLQSRPRWEPRKDACGVYNCFGHVWASRRTSIYEESEIAIILADDGYRPLRSGESPTWGDVALYGDPGSLYHVGLVSEMRALATHDGRSIGVPIPWILSKWNDCSGEVLHHPDDVPWPDTRPRFYTDRL